MNANEHKNCGKIKMTPHAFYYCACCLPKICFYFCFRCIWPNDLESVSWVCSHLPENFHQVWSCYMTVHLFPTLFLLICFVTLWLMCDLLTLKACRVSRVTWSLLNQYEHAMAVKSWVMTIEGDRYWRLESTCPSFWWFLRNCWNGSTSTLRPKKCCQHRSQQCTNRNFGNLTTLSVFYELIFTTLVQKRVLNIRLSYQSQFWQRHCICIQGLFFL